jgi:CHAT domain-containing protein
MIKIKSIHRIILLLTLLLTYHVSNAEAGNLEKISTLRQKTETLIEEGEYDEALKAATETLSLRKIELDPQHYLVAESLGILAKIYYSLGDFSKADSLYKEIIAICENESEHVEIGIAFNNIAQLYLGSGDYFNAELSYKKALNIYRNFLEIDHPLLIKAQNALAFLYVAMGNDLKAIEHNLRIISKIEQATGIGQIDGITLLKKLNIFIKNGEYKKAEKLLNKALKIYTLSFSLPGLIGPATVNFVSNRVKQNKHKKTQALYKESFELYKKIFGHERSEVSDLMINLTKFYISQNDWEEAFKLIKQTQETNNKLIEYVMGFPSYEKKLKFFVFKETVLHIFLSFLFESMDHELSVTQEILDVWLKRKGLILETQKQYQKALFFSNDKHIKQAAMEFFKVRSRLSKLIFLLSKKENTGAYKDKIALLEEQKKELEATLSKLSKIFLTEQKKSNVTCVNLAQSIPSNTVLVDFARISQFNFKNKNNDQTWLQDRYIAFIIHAGNGDKIDWIDLGAADKIDNKISAFKKMIAGINTDMTKDTIDILKKLHSLVFQPIKSKIGNKKELFISPDGDLSLLPFEVLLNNDEKFLIEDYTFNYLSAGRDILGFGETIEGGNKSLIIGNPDFNINNEQKRTIINNLKLKKHDEKSIAKRSKDIPSNGSWQPLPGTQDEVQAIYNLIGKDKAELFTGKEAIEDVLMDWGIPRVLHLATHGFFLENRPIDIKNNDGINRGFSPQPENDQIISPSPLSLNTENPLLRSGIVLAGANKIVNTDDDTISDGIVTSEEILGMNLRGTEMVVLSACDTGLGEVKNGEGVFGLRRAFTQAGAKSLVMSMWKVPDKETKELMVNFYNNIYKKGMNRSQALRQATLKQMQITKDRYKNKNPYFWGAFVFMGEPYL